ncbi:hypothetical protein NPIL_670951 [Nephila pilipes]|uniref:Uncharacterized protein n=1 Tax=Nephila pilipes TaxID=299642 RepID=A0A8X6P9D1_NEPPI|nr:hypothetical protein NPIL_670951 [Nephila pilipes]
MPTPNSSQWSKVVLKGNSRRGSSVYPVGGDDACEFTNCTLILHSSKYVGTTLNVTEETLAKHVGREGRSEPLHLPNEHNSTELPYHSVTVQLFHSSIMPYLKYVYNSTSQ